MYVKKYKKDTRFSTYSIKLQSKYTKIEDFIKDAKKVSGIEYTWFQQDYNKITNGYHISTWFGTDTYTYTIQIEYGNTAKMISNGGVNAYIPLNKYQTQPTTLTYIHELLGPTLYYNTFFTRVCSASSMEFLFLEDDLKVINTYFYGTVGVDWVSPYYNTSQSQSYCWRKYLPQEKKNLFPSSYYAVPPMPLKDWVNKVITNQYDCDCDVL